MSQFYEEVEKKILWNEDFYVNFRVACRLKESLYIIQRVDEVKKKCSDKSIIKKWLSFNLHNTSDEICYMLIYITHCFILTRRVLGMSLFSKMKHRSDQNKTHNILQFGISFMKV